MKITIFFSELILSPTSEFFFQIISKGVTQYSQDDRDRMQNDAQVRAAEMREATDDCTTKIRTQLSADASGLDDDVIKGLASTNQLIKILSGEESSDSSTSESVSAIFVPSYDSYDMSHMCFAVT